MKRGYFVLLAFSLLLLCIAFSLRTPTTGQVIDGITAETDGCSQINNIIISKIYELNSSNTVVLKEGNQISVGNYFVVPGYILNLTGLSGSGLGDFINFTDIISNQNYSANIMGMNIANFTLGSQIYFVNHTNDYIRVDFPQSSNVLMTFYCPYSCIPNWTAVNTSCSGEIITTWYDDSVSCGNLTGRPQNKTYDCDSDGNGLIGNLDSVDEANFNSFEILLGGNVMNISKTYNGTQSVEIKGNGTLRVQFNYNFSNPLNLKNLTVKRQPNAYSYGYIIISGIIGSKTVYVDKKNGSNQICIKDEWIDSISDISADCDDDDEYLLDCPGNDEGFNCNVSGSYYVVSGLNHSGVREVVSASDCLANWSYSNWGSCVNGSQSRTATDRNNCSTTAGRLALTQNCTISIPVTSPACVSNWSCGNWLPEECPPLGNQTRTCTDKNRCGASTKTEARECEYAGSNWLIYLLVGVGALIFIILIVALILLLKRKHDFDSTSKPFTPTMPPTPPAPPLPPAYSLPAPNSPQPIVRPISPALQLRPIGPSAPVN